MLLRDGADGPAVLMGQRGARAAFMPEKFVFPGGAMDAADARVPVTVPAPCRGRLAQGHPVPDALAAAAIRELWEETGLRLARAGAWSDPPPAWQGFAAAGLRPDARALRFVFRAITPPGRPRRFDARFFLADASALAGDPDDFGAACDELSRLHWVSLAQARALDLPRITQVVLEQVTALAGARGVPAAVPFSDNAGAQRCIRYIR